MLFIVYLGALVKRDAPRICGRPMKNCKWILVFLLLSVCLFGCFPERNPDCPSPAALAEDSSLCCDVLSTCCAGLKSPEEKEKCEQYVSDTASATCQAYYQELFTNDKS